MDDYLGKLNILIPYPDFILINKSHLHTSVWWASSSHSDLKFVIS